MHICIDFMHVLFLFFPENDIGYQDLQRNLSMMAYLIVSIYTTVAICNMILLRFQHATLGRITPNIVVEQHSPLKRTRATVATTRLVPALTEGVSTCTPLTLTHTQAPCCIFFRFRCFAFYLIV